MAKRERYSLRYGGRNLVLWKCGRTFAIRPRDSLQRVLMDFPGAEDFEEEHEGFYWVRPKPRGAAAGSVLDRARRHPHVDAGTHVYYSSSDGVPFVPSGLLLLEFTRECERSAAEALLRKHHLEVLETLEAGPWIVRVTQGSANPIKTAQELQQSDGVALAEPDLSSTMVESSILPTDQYLGRQWHLKNRGERPGLAEGADARVVEAWRRASTLGSPEIVVAVLDDGFDLGHPDLATPGKVVNPRDFVDGDAKPYPGPGDWHGTACAGLAVGAANSTGIVGVAPGCRLMPVRWNLRGLAGPNAGPRVRALSDRSFAMMFEYAWRNGASVISCSWEPRAKKYPLSTQQRLTLKRAATLGRQGRGAVICFAAGNQGLDISGRHSHNGFAAHPNVIAVSASTSLDGRRGDSNFGGEIALCAPGGGSPGWNLVTADVRDLRGRVLGYSQGAVTGRFGQTSASCAITAGVAALVLSIRPSLSARDVKILLQKTARKIGDPSAYRRGHSKLFGFGCVNAEKAVAQLL